MVYLLRRFASYYFDNIIVFFLVIIVFIIKQNILGISLMEIDNPNLKILLVYHVIIASFYFISCEFLFLKTIGKKIFKLQIIGIEMPKLRVRFIAVLIRNLSRFIPFEPFSIFLDEERIMWHDKFSKTKVVDIRKK